MKEEDIMAQTLNQKDFSNCLFLFKLFKITDTRIVKIATESISATASTITIKPSFIESLKKKPSIPTIKNQIIDWAIKYTNMANLSSNSSSKALL